MDTTAFMRSIDTRFRAASGLSERRHYSIFYSQVVKSRILVIGFNPGGDPDHWDESLLASRSFYEHGEHEYVDCEYRIAVAMREFLMRTLSLTDVNQIRTIPKTNLVFRRSSNQDTLKISSSRALREAHPFIEEIIQRVQPRAIILEGKVTLDKFEKLYCGTVTAQLDGPPITTPNGRSNACIFQADRALVTCLGRDILLVGIGHPSKYAGRKEWHSVLARSKALLHSVQPRC